MASALILGGTGFIGRHLVVYLVENNLCSYIRVADKVLPATAYLTPRQQKAFEKVDFRQANLTAQSSIEKVFEYEKEWDFVFNLAGETKYSQTEQVYHEKTYLLSLQCAQQAAKSKTKVFVEVSTAQVYDADKKPSDENAKLKPWTLLAKSKLKAEEDLKKVPGLNLIIVRPSIVYGVSDLSGLTPRLIVAAVYKELKEKMELLWTPELRINTVHVQDVVQALYVLAKHFVDGKSPKIENGEVFNLSDSGDTSQENMNKLLEKIFGIKTGFYGSIMSNMAKMFMSDAVETSNEKHLEPWSQLCKRFGIQTTPLTPYLDVELLYNNSLSVDGSKVTKYGFQYSVPEVTEDKLKEVLNEFAELNLFPKGFF